jgi:DnaJ-class molecular chaperone
MSAKREICKTCKGKGLILPDDYLTKLDTTHSVRPCPDCNTNPNGRATATTESQASKPDLKSRAAGDRE